MWEFKSKPLVTLCQPLEQGVEVCHQFWPSTENDPQTYGKITVTLQSSYKLGYVKHGSTAFKVLKDGSGIPSAARALLGPEGLLMR